MPKTVGNISIAAQSLTFQFTGNWQLQLAATAITLTA